MASKRYINNRKSSSTKKVFIILVAIGAIAGLVGGMIISTREPVVTPTSSTTGSSGNITVPVATSALGGEIIARFDCACNTCKLTLAECTCDEPRGSKEMKGYIEYLVKEGKSRDEIIKLVQGKYGHLRS